MSSHSSSVVFVTLLLVAAIRSQVTAPPQYDGPKGDKGEVGAAGVVGLQGAQGPVVSNHI